MPRRARRSAQPLGVMRALRIIDEAVGVGEVRFGMRPSQVKEIMGEILTWERWMNGNVNDALYYPGIILFFDDHQSDGPTADSRLEQIAVRPPFPAQWRGVEISHLTRMVVANLLNDDAKSRDLAEGASELTGPRFHAFFGSSGELTEVSIGAWYDA
jgi:hypothetical protein